MESKTSIIISWIFIILLSTMSAIVIQPHLVNEKSIIVPDKDVTEFINIIEFQQNSNGSIGFDQFGYCVQNVTVVVEPNENDFSGYYGGGGVYAPSDIDYSNMSTFYIGGGSV